MNNDHDKEIISNSNPLFDRVVSILNEARVNVVRSVNTNMVIAYWLIGREIIEEIQQGEQRAGYGKQVVEKLSKQLGNHYGKGFSVTTLQNFRKFYHVYSQRHVIQHPVGVKSLEKERKLIEYRLAEKNDSGDE